MTDRMFNRTIDFFALLIPPVVALALAILHAWCVLEIGSDIEILSDLPRQQRWSYPFVSERPVLYVGYLLVTVAYLAVMGLASQIPRGWLGGVCLGAAFAVHVVTVGAVTLLAGLGLIATLFVLMTSLGQVLLVGTCLSWLAFWLVGQS